MGLHVGAGQSPSHDDVGRAAGARCRFHRSPQVLAQLLGAETVAVRTRSGEAPAVAGTSRFLRWDIRYGTSTRTIVGLGMFGDPE